MINGAFDDEYIEYKYNFSEKKPSIKHNLEEIRPYLGDMINVKNIW